jgi:hypothetical protein
MVAGMRSFAGYLQSAAGSVCERFRDATTLFTLISARGMRLPDLARNDGRRMAAPGSLRLLAG